MNSVIVEVPHAILFVVDPTNNETIIPAYSPDQVVATTDTCVSIATQAPEDGATEILLGIGYENVGNYHLVFNGSISIHGGKIAVLTAELESLLEVDVPNGRTKFLIFVNDVYYASAVVIQLVD